MKLKKTLWELLLLFKKKRECFCTLDLSRQDFHIWLSRVEHEWEEILSLLLGPSEKDTLIKCKQHSRYCTVTHIYFFLGKSHSFSYLKRIIFSSREARWMLTFTRTCSWTMTLNSHCRFIIWTVSNPFHQLKKSCLQVTSQTIIYVSSGFYDTNSTTGLNMYICI